MARWPAPDLGSRREQIIETTTALAEAEGWPAVTMRRLATALGVTQPVLYTVFAGRQALVDEVALEGFRRLADALEDAAPTAPARMETYLDFAAAHPRVYEAMFSMPVDVPFATTAPPEPLARAFAAVSAAFPGADDCRAEVAWAALHGLATLQGANRLRPTHVRERILLLHRVLTETAGPD